MDARQQAALEAIHQELLTLLSDVRDVLEQNHLPYSMVCGSLLGAVRHQGFIPWDDDVDLVLPRESYNRFAELYPHQCSPDFVLDLQDTWVPRVRRRQGSKNAFIDLFVLDPLPTGRLARFVKLFCLRTLQGMLKEETDYQRFSFSKRILLHATHFLGRFCSKAVLLRAYQTLSQKGGRSPLLHMSNGAFALLSMPFVSTAFADPVLTAFETLQVRIPQDTDAVLIQLYGADYMTPPPLEKRIPLHLDI